MYRKIGRFQTDKEIKLDLQPSIVFQLQYFEKNLETLLSEDITSVSGEYLEENIKNLNKQMDKIMYGYQRAFGEEYDDYYKKLTKESCCIEKKIFY